MASETQIMAAETKNLASETQILACFTLNLNKELLKKGMGTNVHLLPFVVSPC